MFYRQYLLNLNPRHTCKTSVLSKHKRMFYLQMLTTVTFLYQASNIYSLCAKYQAGWVKVNSTAVSEILIFKIPFFYVRFHVNEGNIVLIRYTV